MIILLDKIDEKYQIQIQYNPNEYSIDFMNKIKNTLCQL